VTTVAGDTVVARHERLSDKGMTRYDWQHYIPLVQRKPGALRNGAPFTDLPESRPLAFVNCRARCAQAPASYVHRLWPAERKVPASTPVEETCLLFRRARLRRCGRGAAGLRRGCCSLRLGLCLFLLCGLVMPNGTPAGGSQNSMTAGDVACNTADRSPGQAPRIGSSARKPENENRCTK